MDLDAGCRYSSEEAVVHKDGHSPLGRNSHGPKEGHPVCRPDGCWEEEDNDHMTGEVVVVVCRRLGVLQKCLAGVRISSAMRELGDAS